MKSLAHRYSIRDLASRMEAGLVTAEALLSDALTRIAADDRNDSPLCAIRQLDPGAMAQARALDAERAARGTVRGPLHGIPMVVKDNIDMVGLPTTSGSRALAGAMPWRDAEQTRRLREAGAVIVGKTNLSEFSFEIRSLSSLGGDVRNPFNRAVTAGGSSGGTAAAIAAGFVVAGLGTDTGGSIRTPASFNGLVGLRPTHGLIDRRGTAPLAPSTDTVGPIATVVTDVATLLAVMTDAPHSRWLPPTPRRLAGARLGILRQAFGADAEIGAAMEAAIQVMAAAGAAIVDPVRLPDEILPADRPHVVDWEFRPAFNAYLAANFRPGTAPRSIEEIIAGGDFLPEHRAALQRRAAMPELDAPAYRDILAYHRRLRDALLALMEADGIDALVYPTAAVVPDSFGNPRGGWAPELAACSGFPALTLPVGQAASGIPIGLELLSRTGDEALLLQLADDLESRI